jgi:hypothetical protein
MIGCSRAHSSTRHEVSITKTVRRPHGTCYASQGFPPKMPLARFSLHGLDEHIRRYVQRWQAFRELIPDPSDRLDGGGARKFFLCSKR